MSRWYDLAGGDGHPVGLTEARKPNWKPQGPVDFFGSTGCLVGAIPANNRWYQKSVEPYVYLPMSRWDDLAGGTGTL